MSDRRIAERENEKGRALLDEGLLEEAVVHFRRATTAAPDWSVPFYNLGLASKFQKHWTESLEANWRAHQLNPEDDAAFWNLAIAAGALGDWAKARVAFEAMGMQVPDDPGPWDLRLGLIPIRINPEHEPEVVWCHRLDPVRAQIASVPILRSQRRFGDVLLTDGAPTGYRQLGDQEVPVFNELAVLSESPLQTWKAEVEVRNKDVMGDLIAFLSEHGVMAEDWTESLQFLCKACSEGRPHEHHDRDLQGAWRPLREVGLAVPPGEDAEGLIGGFARVKFLSLVGGAQADSSSHLKKL